MFLRFIGKALGMDELRDKELFFLACLLQFGAPPKTVGAEFAALALKSNMPCRGAQDFWKLHEEYREWYETCATASTKSI